MVLRIGGDNARLEYCPRFAWIGIDRKIQYICCQPPEIDDAVLDWLHLVRRVNLSFPFVAFAIVEMPNLIRWSEHQLNGLIDLVLDRIKRDHAGLPDPSRYTAPHMNSAPALRRDFERS